MFAICSLYVKRCKQPCKKRKPKRKCKCRFTPCPCKVKPFGFLRKNLPFLASLEKSIFSQKTLPVTLFARIILHSFFLFSVFLFSGASLFVALRSVPRCELATADPPHSCALSVPALGFLVLLQSAVRPAPPNRRRAVEVARSV